MVAVDANTRLYGIIGHPLSHTLSPAMQNAAFEAAGMNAVYLAFDTPCLREALQGLKAVGCLGLSITVPFKEKVLQYLDEIDPMARGIGAVNTLVSKGEKWVGYNTDASGALRALEEVIQVKGQDCVILGAGGAARAIGVALKDRGCALTIINRSKDRGKRLAEHLNAKYLSLYEVEQIQTNIFIQATSVGMHPDQNTAPIEPGKIQASVVMDIVYNPLETKLLKECGQRGAITIAGTRMLLYQGAEQFRLWTGVEAPIEAMERAVQSALERMS